MDNNRQPVERMCISIDMEATGSNIKKLIKESGYSMSEIMMITGVSTPQAVYKWYRGKSIPEIETLLVLSNILGKNIDRILVLN